MIVSCVGIGVGAQSHIAIGEAYLLCHGPVCVTPSWVKIEQIEQEVLRFESAIQIAADELRTVREQIPGDAPNDIAEFIDSHLLMIEDKAISSGVIDQIRSKHTSAEWSLQQQRDILVKVFNQMEDTYLRTRCDDIDHVVRRIQKILLAQHDEPSGDLSGQIVLADDLSPADIILLNNQNIAGFVTEYGGPMSHTTILARSLDIPAVIGARGATRCLRHAELLVLDTDNGCVLAGCDQSTINHYEDQREFHHERTLQLRRNCEQPARTQDGTQIQLLANIELASDVDTALRNGADGIGLYRTEFLYMNRQDIPSEEEHFQTYRSVVEGMQGRPVTIRTLDLGADKQAPDARYQSLSSNPALGLRAIRLCLKEPSLFIPQIRAILRASAHGPVSIMLPMLTNLWEVEQAKAVITQAMDALRQEGMAFDPKIPIGGMIEVPAAALAARAFAKQLDFLSIGTNDLIQYTLAIDRIDDEVNYLYDPFHPAVIDLIAGTIKAANNSNTPVSICGEMGGDLRFVPLLLGLGLRNLSMQPAALLDVKQQLNSLDMTKLSDKAASFLEHMHNEDPLSLLNSWH